MRKIVIPTDFSENAFNAAGYTLELFKYFKCEVFIVHAYADEVYDQEALKERSDIEEIKHAKLEKSDETLHSIKAELTNRFGNPKHRCHIISKFGSLVDVVNDIVEHENIDLVAMGTRGKTNDRELTFGSHTLQVIKYVKCPVLAIPENYEGIHPKNLLFPTDYILPYKQRELKLVATMAERITTAIHCLYISNFRELSNRQQDNKAFLEFAFKNNQLSFHQEVGEDITESINRFIDKFDIDILVMVNSRHSFLENILYTSTIEKIGLTIKIPFLVLQNLQRH